MRHLAHRGQERRAAQPPIRPHENWARRVGLHGTHNLEPFEVLNTYLEVDIDESRGDAERGPDGESFGCIVRVVHTTKVAHHTAELWFPISDLGPIKEFGVKLDGEVVRGSVL
eukprot:Hpha_TRINITY_DN19230_c0_g1::TRINITY_DN19230_c0_g1_i1::g.194271::m.194271